MKSPVCGPVVMLLRVKCELVGCLFLVFTNLICSVAAEAPSATANSLSLLSNAQQVVALGIEGARRNPHPVRFRAVVIYPSVGVRNRVYVQDETAGIQVTATNLDFQATPGQLVEVIGTAAPGPFYTYVNGANVRLIGTAPLPEPKRTPVARLAAGEDFARWLSLKATVYDVAIRGGVLWLHAVADEYLFTVLVTRTTDQPLPVDWLDAELEFHGVTWVFFGANNNASGFRLHVPGTEFVKVLRPGSSNVFDRPLARASELREAAGGGRVKVTGVVTHYSPAGSLAVRDSTGPVFAQRLNTLLPDDQRGQYVIHPPQVALKPGDRIELIGAPSAQRAVAPLLLHAEYRVLGHESSPPPRDITRQKAASGDYDGELVRLEGRLIDQLSRRDGSILNQTLWLQAGGSLFEALLQTEGAVAIPGENNNLVEVVGVCSVQPSELNQVRSFRILLREASDVRVLRAAPVWLTAQAGRILGGAGTLGVAALGWILLLRRRVVQQAERIRALDREAELETRYRELFETQPYMFYRTSLDGRIQFCSPACERLLGYTAEEIAGKSAIQLYCDPNDREKLVRAVTENGSVSDMEIRFRRKDGHAGTFSVNARVVRDARGTVVATEGFVRDISARKQAEEKLRALNVELEERVALRTGELKRANQELQESEAHVRLIIDTALDGVITMDAGGLIQGWNAQAEIIFGWPASEVMGRPLATTIIPTQLRAAHERGIKHFLATGEGPVLNKRIEITALHRDRREFPVELTIAPMRVGADTIFSAFVRDITERKRAEQQKETFSKLGQRLSAAASVNEAARIVMDVSDHLFGWDSCSFDLYSAEQDVTFSVLTMDTVDGKRVPVPPALTGSAPSPIMRRTITEGAQLILRKNPDQERSPDLTPFGDSQRPSASLMFVPIRNGAQVTGTMSIQSYTRDAYNRGDLETLQALADHCSAAMERIQAEHQFRSIFENAVEGICRATREGRFLAANPALARMFGYASPEELIRSITDIGKQLYVKPEQWTEFTQQLNSNDVVQGFEAEFYRKDGSRIWVSQSGKTVRDARGTLRHYEGTIEDITERKQVENELIRALAKEKELGELKSNFVSMVSHEFRTPLEVIMSSGEILERYLDKLKPEQREQHLQAIHKSVKRMAGLMEEVLLLAKVEAGKMEFKPVAFDLPGFCRRLIDEILSATNYQCPIHFESEDLPPDARGDESLLRHVFINLLSNAVKYSSNGSPVHFRLRRQAGLAVFRIEDSGLGIPAADQPRLFQAFHRGKNVEHLSGTGLGLVIVKRCVHMHGGRIQCESVEGRGTTFTVWMPLFGQSLDVSSETRFFHKQTVKV